MTDDLYTSPPITDDPPRGQGISRYVIAVVFVVLGAAVMASNRSFDLGPLGVVGLIVAAAVTAGAVAVGLYLFRHRGGAR